MATLAVVSRGAAIACGGAWWRARSAVRGHADRAPQQQSAAGITGSGGGSGNASSRKRHVVLKVWRYDGKADGKSKPYMASYTVDLDSLGTQHVMLLDALMHIKEHTDPTLSFRKSCREGICGSCSMNINGTNGLACVTPLDECSRKSSSPFSPTVEGTVVVRPLPHMPVMKDLVPDMRNFYQHLRSVSPWLELSDADAAKPTEVLQTPEQRKKLDNLYECVLCACCSTSCPSYWWSSGGDKRFLGPSVLQQAYRWISDSRDSKAKERLQKLAKDELRVFKCHTILNCTPACPKKLNPAKSVAALKLLMHDLPEGDATTQPTTTAKATEQQ
eukprot:TRINITY_DN4250_c0_g1_i1.p1 TRINITY_DN4250_c0_g1~~TRINITY_DN4250_c0_g1_i1.p1  ORF type:complete len:353 (-),score=69.84 TRINITY_DN4250_c0_g1_i1:25-1017(-)